MTSIAHTYNPDVPCSGYQPMPPEQTPLRSSSRSICPLLAARAWSSAALRRRWAAPKKVASATSISRSSTLIPARKRAANSRSRRYVGQSVSSTQRIARSFTGRCLRSHFGAPRSASPADLP